MDWDARRFATLYAAFVKRKAVEELEQQKLGIMTGLWGNSNWDAENNPRQNAIQSIEDDVNDKIATIYGMAPSKEDEFAINPNDPFWAAMYRNLEKQHGTAKPTKEEVDRAIADQDIKGQLNIDSDIDQM